MHSRPLLPWLATSRQSPNQIEWIGTHSHISLTIFCCICCWSCLILEENGHPQLPTSIHCDNSTATGIAYDTVKKKAHDPWKCNTFGLQIRCTKAFHCWLIPKIAFIYNWKSSSLLQYIMATEEIQTKYIHNNSQMKLDQLITCYINWIYSGDLLSPQQVFIVNSSLIIIANNVHVNITIIFLRNSNM